MSGDKTLSIDDWRQGDLALEPLELPVISFDGELVWQAIDATHGVVMISQSCDIVREFERRPYVQVAALVPATDDEIAKAIRGETPSRIHLNCLNNKGLLIDLDVMATVHKAVVAKWQRVIGCKLNDERRRVAAGISRHKQRFAFPDTFNDMIKPMRKWIESKRSKASPQGNFVRALDEVRVHCDDWENPTELTFIAIVNHIPEQEELTHWNATAKLLQNKAVHDAYPEGEIRIVTYDDISAREYLATDRLDWEGLSDAT